MIHLKLAGRRTGCILTMAGDSPFAPRDHLEASVPCILHGLSRRSA